MAGSFIRKRGKKRYGQFSEINVTPFVDVMLVLLIVFMVSAPLLSTGIPIDLPESEAKALSEQDNAPLEITLDENGVIFVGETKASREKFLPLLTNIMRQKEDQRIYLRADETLAYSNVMDVLGAMNKAGFNKVALISKPASKTP